MSAPPAAARRTDDAAAEQQQGGGTTSSAARDIGGGGRGRGSRHHQHHHHQQSDGTGQSPGSFGRRSNSDGGGGRRYGQWPPTAAAAGSSPQQQPRHHHSSSSSHRHQQHHQGSGGGERSFTWPAYMEAADLQRAMKSGRVFRAKFRVNAANRTEGFCTLEGLPSDLLVRGDVNHNRAVEGDEVAVLAFRLRDWFKVHKERDRLAELGLLPEGDADPLGVAERLSQLALDSNDQEALAVAQSPWWAAGSRAGAVAKLEELLLARPDLRVTGKVVSILEPSRKRQAIVGVLLHPQTAMAAAPPPPGGTPSPAAAAAAAALAAGAYSDCLMLFPLDPRMPKCLVPPASLAALPQELQDEAVREDLTTRTFVTAAVTQWPAGSPFPHAEVRQSLGPSDDIESGTKALLAAEQICEDDFSLEVYACLPRVPWSVAPSDLESRADFTSWRIFSIDPITARDLDDALSIQPLGGGRWRVGVHIADVASFVAPGTALDQEAALRGTSVYLVQRVIPMLPRLLCEELCSLHPGFPRYAFSLVWELDEDGTIHREWAGRSIISSRAKLGYPMVQQMIEGCFDPAAWGIALHEGATWDQITADCLALHGISSRLRAARFRAGALRLTNTRLSFALDTGGNPVSAAPYVQAAANFLVEEFMLLANTRVAARIADAFPQHALLRRHPPPSARKMQELLAVGERLGVAVRAETAGALAVSLQALKDACADEATSQALMLLATKPMQLAQYFCTSTEPDPAAWRHYALAMGHYTHFTSPIRRYPDLIVHRLLAAALELAAQQQQPNGAELLALPVLASAPLPAPVDYSEATYDPAFAAAAAAAVAPGVAGGARHRRGRSGGGGEEAEGEGEEEEDAEVLAAASAAEAMLQLHQLPPAKEVEALAQHCNDTKLSARNASDGSLKLYLCLMLRENPVVTTAVVVGVGGDRFFTVYIPELGCETRMVINMQGLPLTGAFDEASQALTITRAEQQQHQQAQQAQDAVVQDQHQALPPQLRLNSESFELPAWLQAMQGKVLDPHRIAKAQLPLQVRQFSHIPVIVGSYSNRVTCHPEDVSAKLWVDCGVAVAAAAAAPAGAPPMPAAAAAQVRPSAMVMETLFED